MPTPAFRASLVAQWVKHLPTMRETRVRSLGREDPLEKEMATHSSTHAWKIPWTEKPCRVQSMGLQSRTQLSDFPSPFQTCFHFQLKLHSSPTLTTLLPICSPHWLRFCKIWQNFDPWWTQLLTFSGPIPGLLSRSRKEKIQNYKDNTFKLLVCNLN